MKPNAVEILAAIADVITGDWPDVENWYGQLWGCLLYDNATGECVAEGDGRTIGEAMALTWVAYWKPNALDEGEVEPGAVPFAIPPDKWCFELFPPKQSEDDESISDDIRFKLVPPIPLLKGERS